MVVQCPNCPTYLSIDYRWCPNCRTELNTSDLNRMRRAEEFEARWIWQIIIVAGAVLCLMVTALVRLFMGIGHRYGTPVAVAIPILSLLGIFGERYRHKTFTKQLNDATYK